MRRTLTLNLLVPTGSHWFRELPGNWFRWEGCASQRTLPGTTAKIKPTGSQTRTFPNNHNQHAERTEK